MAKNVTPVTWSMTIPHSAFAITYENFFKACPVEDNILRCERKGSYRFSEPKPFTIARFWLPFQGSAIEIYGSVAPGIKYSTAISRETDLVEGKVQGTLLARHENLPRSNIQWQRHQTLYLEVIHPEAYGSLNFTHAIVYVDTQATEGIPEVTSYTPDSANVTLTAGWDRNGSYWKANSSSAKAQFEFEGNGVLTYGMCTNTDGNDASSESDVFVDGERSPFEHLDWSKKSAYMVEDCLLHWEVWLDSGRHNLTWNTNGDPIKISRFDVVTFPSSGSVVGTPSLSAGGIVSIIAMIAFLFV